MVVVIDHVDRLTNYSGSRVIIAVEASSSRVVVASLAIVVD